MENASKALIIAGAILISILLITIGIMLINSGRDVTSTGTSQMNSQKIQIFNGNFTAYEGTKKGSEIRDIFSKAKSVSASDSEHKVDVTGIDSAADLKATTNYIVKLEYCPSTVPSGKTTEPGYIYEINITEATK